MKSIKPGRGPSMMSGVMCIFVALFGIIWTIVAASAGGGIFALFGLVFIAIAIVQAVYNFKNATSKNRYSAFDITEDNEEVDPLNERFGNQFSPSTHPAATGADNAFCPYCGNPVADEYEYCNKCGRKLP